MTQTLTQLVQRTITRLSMVPGVAVQVYAEDRLAEMIWHKFTVVRDELWWDDYMEVTTLTQDSQGRPIEHVVRELPLLPLGDEIVIHSYNDVQHAWAPNRRSPLRSAPARSNPAGLLRQGSTLYRMPDSVKVIRFAPFTQGMPMSVRYKRWYSRFLPNDTVPMDDQLLILGACYDYLEDDGTNPRQAEKFGALFNDRLGQLKSGENEREIALSPVHAPSSNGWQTVA